MADDSQKHAESESTRRRFLKRLGQGAVAGSVAAALWSEGCSGTSAEPGEAPQPTSPAQSPETTEPAERTPAAHRGTRLSGSCVQHATEWWRRPGVSGSPGMPA